MFDYSNQLKNALKRKIYEEAGVTLSKKQSKKRQSGGSEAYEAETLPAVRCLFCLYIVLIVTAFRTKGLKLEIPQKSGRAFLSACSSLQKVLI